MPATMTVRRAAAELGITPVRVQQLIRSGRLPAEKASPRLWLIDPRDLDKVRDRKPGRPPTVKPNRARAR